MKPKQYIKGMMVLALTLLIPLANADLYKCTDDIGRVHYSQTEGELEHLCKIVTPITPDYTKEDVARWAKLQNQYEKQVYRNKVRAAARLLDDIEEARKKK